MKTESVDEDRYRSLAGNDSVAIGNTVESSERERQSA